MGLRRLFKGQAQVKGFKLRVYLDLKSAKWRCGPTCPGESCLDGELGYERFWKSRRPQTMMALGKCLGDISANHPWFCRLATGQWAFDTPRISFGYVQDGHIVTAV